MAAAATASGVAPSAYASAAAAVKDAAEVAQLPTDEHREVAITGGEGDGDRVVLMDDATAERMRATWSVKPASGGGG